MLAARTDDVVVYDEYGPVRMVRTREWKYVHRYPDGPHELFDLARRSGRAREPRRRSPRIGATVGDAARAARRLVRAYVDPARDGAHKRVTGCGQLGLTPADGDGSDVFPADPIAPLAVPTADR